MEFYILVLVLILIERSYQVYRGPEWEVTAPCFGEDHLPCTYYDMTCPIDGDKPHIIALGPMKYGSKNGLCATENIENCGNHKELCCTPDNADCSQTFSDEDMFAIYSRCSGKSECRGRIQTLPWPYICVDVPSYAAIQYQCIPPTNVVNMCDIGVVTGNYVHMMFDGTKKPSFDDESCFCVAYSKTCGGIITFSGVDIRLQREATLGGPRCSKTQVKITANDEKIGLECQEEQPLSSFNYNSFTIARSATYTTLEVGKIRHDDYPMRVWISIKPVIAGNVTVICGPPGAKPVILNPPCPQIPENIMTEPESISMISMPPLTLNTGSEQSTEPTIIFSISEIASNTSQNTDTKGNVSAAVTGHQITTTAIPNPATQTSPNVWLTVQTLKTAPVLPIPYTKYVVTTATTTTMRGVVTSPERKTSWDTGKAVGVSVAAIAGILMVIGLVIIIWQCKAQRDIQKKKREDENNIYDVISDVAENFRSIPNGKPSSGNPYASVPIISPVAQSEANEDDYNRISLRSNRQIVYDPRYGILGSSNRDSTDSAGYAFVGSERDQHQESGEINHGFRGRSDSDEACDEYSHIDEHSEALVCCNDRPNRKSNEYSEIVLFEQGRRTQPKASPEGLFTDRSRRSRGSNDYSEIVVFSKDSYIKSKQVSDNAPVNKCEDPTSSKQSRVNQLVHDLEECASKRDANSLSRETRPPAYAVVRKPRRNDKTPERKNSARSSR